MNLSEHFTLEELSNTSHSDLKDKNATYARENICKLQTLAEYILEPCRAICGPLIVNSGCRCPELNKRVGGNAKSQHCLCEAADLTPTKMSVKEAFDKIRKSGVPYGQLILETVGGKTWIHISLGVPFRDASKCGQTYIYDGKTYKVVK